MDYGMPTLIENDNIMETVKLCNNLGFQFVELNMNLPQYQITGLKQYDSLQKIAKEYGIYYTIHLDENLNIWDFNLEVAAAYRNTVKESIKVAKELHIPILNMHMNPGVYFTLPSKKVYLYEQYMEQYIEDTIAFRTMCEAAIGDEDIRICIENTEGYTTYQREAVRQLLESNVFGLTWDIGHSYVADNKDENFLLEYQGHLNHFHIHDGKGIKNHMALGTGEIDLQKYLSLAEHKNCRCVIETKTVQALWESLDWLKAKGYIEI